ncbi:RNA-binding protein 42 [Exaiptasia diaphana]|uniref:RNA-binding protein 42 n=1 Tax=Exaiptasia diaphana TaxID=2652724 RepID=A0A913X5H1_EXADI|nr:RNA-binding protein 42 [Exaiptasia diaphana]KXJ15064.1 RNA-binding protein 42 [Exaiptasia diaphana]
MSLPGSSDESKRKNELEEEMSRFEQEIAGHPVAKPPPIISASTFRKATQAIQDARVNQPPLQVPMHVQPLPRPPVPPQMPQQPQFYSPPNMARPPIMNHLHRHPAGPMVSQPPQPVRIQQRPQMHQMMAAAPMMPVAAGPTYPVPMAGPVVPPPVGVPPTITPAEQKEWESAYKHNEGDDKKKGKDKKFVRVAGSQVWEDPSLSSWDPNDFRIFCGDLGNEVTDESLTRAFSKYPSFLRAKIIRDKKSSKTKGYGFVSFKDPNDFIKAMREMNGKYIGNRPIKLRKSTWKDRNIDVVRKKVKEKKKLGLR